MSCVYYCNSLKTAWFREKIADLATLHPTWASSKIILILRKLIAAPWCAKIIFNIRMFVGAYSKSQKFSGIKKTVPHRALVQKHTQWMATVESKSWIPDILGNLEIPSGYIFLCLKRACPGKRGRMVTLTW